MSKPNKQAPVTAPYSVLNTVIALLEQAKQLLEIQGQTLMATPVQADAGENPFQQELMDVNQLVKYLGVSEWGIREMVKAKRVPHIRVQKRIFFRRREIDQWISMGMASGIGDKV